MLHDTPGSFQAYQRAGPRAGGRRAGGRCPLAISRAVDDRSRRAAMPPGRGRAPRICGVRAGRADNLLAGMFQAAPGGCEHSHAGAVPEELGGQVAGAVEDVLAVVQYELQIDLVVVGGAGGRRGGGGADGGQRVDSERYAVVTEALDLNLEGLGLADARRAVGDIRLRVRSAEVSRSLSVSRARPRRRPISTRPAATRSAASLAPGRTTARTPTRLPLTPPGAQTCWVALGVGHRHAGDHLVTDRGPVAVRGDERQRQPRCHRRCGHRRAAAAAHLGRGWAAGLRHSALPIYLAACSSA